jgi:hypothetical protein
VVPTHLDWDEANQAAQRLSYNGIRGHLVTVTSKAESDFVKTLVSGSSAAYWIGADKRDGSSEWKWVADRAFDRQRISPSYWAAAQPNGGGNCLELHADGTWNDEACVYDRAYIVEFDAEPEPNPDRMSFMMLCGIGSLMQFVGIVHLHLTDLAYI